MDNANQWALLKQRSGVRWTSYETIFSLACGAAVGLSGLALAADTPKSPTVTVNEESVLIAAREITQSQSLTDDDTIFADDGGLQPTPQTSDHEPELACTDVNEPKSQEVCIAEDPIVIKEAATASSRGTAQQTAAPLENSTAPFEPVRFQGILVGESMRRELIEGWGNPDKSVNTFEGVVLAYHIHPFDVVEVLVGQDEIVSAIKIALRTPLEPDDLAKQLSLDTHRPLIVQDEDDQPLGQVFPERGVMFMFDASHSDALTGDGNVTPKVTHVVVQPLTASTFVMRAEQNLHGEYHANINDLKTSLSLEPNDAHAQYLLAEIYLATGQADLAETAAARACELNPNNATYQLCRSHAQELLGEYDQAVLTTRAILDRENIAPIEKAQALYRMGCLASFGDVEIASKAIPFLTRSIELADEAATSFDTKERRAAKQLLVEAHMAMAEEIARQSFNDKLESLSLWIGRASGLAEDFIANDGGSLELRLMIARRAVAALSNFRPALDPAPWVAEAKDAARALLKQCDDELWRSRINWELGIAYFHAMRVEHTRRETEKALEYGRLAIENMAEGATTRQAVHSSEQLAGQLYFQMGAIHAVHKLDHKKAVEWYDKAEELLTAPRPVSELYSPRREGEMLVSMGVTYWQIGEHAQALRLTQHGVGLIEIAVEDGILASTALAVPYGNLASMYKQVGETSNAAKYNELSKSVEPAAKKAPQSVVRQTQPRQSSKIQQTTGQQSRSWVR